jgi:trypsin
MKKAFLFIIFCSTIYWSQIVEMSSRIVGGEPADIQDYPYQAILTNGDNVVCGGAILGSEFSKSTSWVLTAAHCASHFTSVTVGIDDLKHLNSVEKYGIKRVIAHPNFNSKTLQNDIALIELEKAIVFDEKKQRISFLLEDAYLLNSQDSLIVSGFGTTHYGGGASRILLRVTLNWIPIEEAGKTYNIYKQFEQKKLITAEGKNKDACQGDSGGPLIVRKNKIPLLLGIVSFGPHSCGKTAGAYTRVQYFSDWIYKHTGIEPLIIEHNQPASIPSIIYGEAEIFIEATPA